MGRKSVEYQVTEIIVAGAISCDARHITDLTEKLSVQPNNLIITKSKYQKYIELLKSYDKNMDNYLIKFNELFKKNKEIKYVFLIGKSINNIPQRHRLKIKEWIAECSSLNRSDIYIEYSDGTYEGISVKASKVATKTNMSVEKMIKENSGIDLSVVRKRFLADAGFKVYRKTDRREHNKLFYENNLYWGRMNESIKTNIDFITTRVIDCLFPRCNHNILEFDGEQMRYLTNVRLKETPTLRLDEYANMYTPTGRIRRAAKQFYNLYCEGETYRCEIRWKGTIFTASPQIQIHAMER